MFNKIFFCAWLFLATHSTCYAETLSYSISPLPIVAQSTSNTWIGTGFVGMYSGHGGPYANPFFSIGEGTASSRVALEVDVSALNGVSINNAFLQYEAIISPSKALQTMALTAFTANGTLGFYLNRPDSLLSGSAVAVNGFNNINVTDYLNAALVTNTGWFGLHLQASDFGTFQSANMTNQDGIPIAGFPLTMIVDFTGLTPVPAPAPFSLLGAGLLALAASCGRCYKNK